MRSSLPLTCLLRRFGSAVRHLLGIYWSWRYLYSSRSRSGDKTIHQLAATKVLGELKDRTSYLHNKYKSITGDIREGGFEEAVKREGVRVGLKYDVASEWTSFVTVVKREGDVQQQEWEREGQKEEEECGLDEEG